MSYIRIILSAVTVAFLSGCASKNIPLESSVGAAYRGKTITYSYHEKTDFSAMSAGKAMFGAVGAAGMINKGNKIIKENEVKDPAPTIGVTLATDLAQKYNLTLVHPAQVAKSRKLSAVAAAYAPQADLVLDVQTRNWGYCYFPTDWNNYFVMYSAKLQLIDTRKEQEIATGSFAYDSKDNPNPPTNEELVLNGAARLKAELVKAQNQCIIEMRQRIFRN